MITQEMIENSFNDLNTDMTFEDILEMFDLTPLEVFTFLFYSGKIDEEILENLCNV